MFKVEYIFEYANGGWKHFNKEFNNREEFRTFVRSIKNDPKCICYVTTYTDRGFSKINEKENGKWIRSISSVG